MSEHHDPIVRVVLLRYHAHAFRLAAAAGTRLPPYLRAALIACAQDAILSPPSFGNVPEECVAVSVPRSVVERFRDDVQHGAIAIDASMLGAVVRALEGHAEAPAPAEQVPREPTGDGRPPDVAGQVSLPAGVLSP